MNRQQAILKANGQANKRGASIHFGRNNKKITNTAREGWIGRWFDGRKILQGEKDDSHSDILEMFNQDPFVISALSKGYVLIGEYTKPENHKGSEEFIVINIAKSKKGVKNALAYLSKTRSTWFDFEYLSETEGAKTFFHISRTQLKQKLMKLQVGKIENPVFESILGGMAAGAAAGFVGARMAKMKDENEELKKKVRNPESLGYKSAFLNSKGEVKKRFNPEESRENVRLEIWMNGGKGGKGEKNYTYEFTNIETAVRKMVDFVERTGELWDVQIVIKEYGKVKVKGNYVRGEWTIYEGSYWFDMINRKVKNSGLGGRKIMKAKRSMKNPEEIEEYVKMAEEFHGREVNEIVEVEEEENEDLDLAVLGILTELEIVTEDGKDAVEIEFAEDMDEKRYVNVDRGMNKYIRVCTNEKGDQLYFVGGDQDISDDLSQLKKAGCLVQDKTRKVLVGELVSVSYFADKHHLAGPESQKDGAFYIHELGEESGIRPMLVFDKINEKMEIVGGNYNVRDVGIKD
ncbi:MAG: hypothetical protein DDT42_01926 [candidate division WS2 bacterium]|uniref:Uncharacterized protein n=1 Tax=Psychracetigena formicireducens TaxID=2986056 RepID=A0A9E2BJ31_PSYF1|nr:hypothetical protein [Candidatus Psychracetigena formicireducens]